MNLAALALLPAALLVDRLFGEPPSRLHPVCLIGAFAARVETLLRRGPNGARMFLSGALACLLAARADTVIEMFCGIPTVLKGDMPC